MKNLLILLFFLIISKSTNAQIVYLDVNYILNNSEVGKSLNNHLKEITESNKIRYKKIESEIVTKEQSLISKKNILDKSEFDKKLSDLSIEVNKYRKDLKIAENKIKQIKIENTKKILNQLNPLIKEYVEKNSISLVMPKKNIIIGKKNLDITEDITKLLNENMKLINFDND